MTIIIDSKNYEESVIGAVKDLAQSTWSKLQASLSRVQRGGQTTHNDLANAIEFKTGEKEIADQVRNKKLSPIKAYLAVSDKGTHDFDKVNDIRKLAWKLENELEAQKKPHQTYNEIEAEYMPSAKEAIKETLRLADAVKKTIKGATSRVDSWGKTPITIEVSEPTEYEVATPVSSFQIIIGRRTTAPVFTMFVNEKTGKTQNIDDVLHAGDTEFFQDPVEQKNYFDLIAEIENPGSTKRPGKKLTLYTARPIRDRRLYTNAKKVPVGIFLTSDPDRAMGIAGDLGGRERLRDLWMVRMDSRYLVKTLDTGRIKDYQVVGGHKTVPVISMELIEEGTESTRPPRLSPKLTEAKLSAALNQIKQHLMANDPSTFSDYGEYELSGSLKERVEEIIFNHAYEAGMNGTERLARKQLEKTLFALAKQEGFKAVAEKAWKDGVKSGKGTESFRPSRLSQRLMEAMR